MKPGLLKTDHHVVSAEGTRYSVRYVWRPDGEPEQADLAELNDQGDWSTDSERVTLPTAELRRVTARRVPPVTGIPKKRLHCVMCQQPVPYWTNVVRGASYHTVVSRTFDQWRGYKANADGTERFCTLRCAHTFARAAFAAGYRIKRNQ